MRCWSALLAVSCLLTSASAWADDQEKNKWHGQAAAGADFGFVPELAGFGFALFQTSRDDLVGSGDLRLYFNTDTLEVGLDRISLAKNLELSVALRGEALFAGLLRYYYQNGLQDGAFGFNASYIVLRNKLQWHFAAAHTLEVIADVRHWWFGEQNTSPSYALPNDSWVFEPRIGYIYWKVRSPGGEWGADKLFPRFLGNAAGVSVGVDVRSDDSAWGLDDGRNDPSKAILSINQWYRGGWQLSDFFRLEVQETANWGEGQDDITRQRVGGMNPYSIVVPGLPWAGILSERLLIAQASANFRVKKNKPHELGVLLSGGTVNDPFRVGDLKDFGGIGGIGLITELRFGIVSLYGRLGYAFPVDWLSDDPFLSFFGGIGVDAF
jgi:hypothetical protein